MNLHNGDFENSIIGAIIADRSCLFDVMPILEPASFATGCCGMAYGSALRLEKEGVAVDVITLSDDLEKADPNTNWMLWLAEISKNHYQVKNVRDYALAVREYHDLRKLLKAGQSIVETCNDPEMKLGEKIDEAQQSILDLQTQSTTDPVRSRDLLRAFVDHIEECGKSQGGLTGLSTGFPHLDNACKGLHEGELIIVAARPAMGKTNFALNVASHVINNNKSVLLFSLEMTKNEIMGRLCAARSMLDYDRVLSADFDRQSKDGEWTAFTSFVASMKDAPIAIDDDSSLSVADLRSKARRHKMQFGLDLIIVDYLQLLDGPGDSLTEKTSNISTALKRLAKDMGVPVIALSQLNRSLESRSDRRPIMSDLRQSGAIEQDANMILFLYRDVVYNKGCNNPHLAELDIAKLRHGKTQTLTLETQFHKCRFVPTEEIANGFVEEEAESSSKSSSFKNRNNGYVSN